MTTHADRIEKALAEHDDWDYEGDEVIPTCHCGEVLHLPDGHDFGDDQAAHRAHVAAVLAALTPEPVAGGLAGHRYGVMDGRGGEWLVESTDEYPEPSPIGLVDDILRDAARAVPCAKSHLDDIVPGGFTRLEAITNAAKVEIIDEVARRVRAVPVPAEAPPFQPDRDLIANAEGNQRILAADLAAYDAAFPVPAETDGEAEALVEVCEAHGRCTIVQDGGRDGPHVWSCGMETGSYDRMGWAAPHLADALTAAGYSRRPAETDGLADAWDDGWATRHKAPVAERAWRWRTKRNPHLLDVAAPAEKTLQGCPTHGTSPLSSCVLCGRVLGPNWWDVAAPAPEGEG